MDRDQTVEKLVHEWQSLQERGEAVTIEQLCASSPDVAPEVEKKIRAVASMAAFLDLDSRLDARHSPPTMSHRAENTATIDVPVDLERRELWHERYKIGTKLGEGGMGVVYRARDSRNGRDVALKLLKGTLTGTARRRFEREFRSLAALRHPHCLSVYDYGELDGGPFFTMELFLGRPITSLTGKSVAEVLEPLLQLTHALDYIHAHGVVHRDVKPSNILVRPSARDDGSSYFETRLMDFGLAKYCGVKSSLSAEAGFVGTVAYCAPEQLNLDELDHRADLFCLGLVSYELLSGRYPFPEARLSGMRPLMQALLNDKPRPLSEVNPEVPRPIADAVMKYLRKQPRRRPDSTSLLRNAITEYLGLADQAALSMTTFTPTRPMLSVTGFVCRASEQEILDDVLRQCLTSQRQASNHVPSLVLVSGEPGIGKSSVVQEAERIARGHGCQVYEGRCFDGNLSPFQPFVEILRQLLADLRLQERREAVAVVDDDLTGTLAVGLPLESMTRLLSIVGNYSGELLRIAPELRKYLPGEAFQQVDYRREADYIYRALSAFFIEIAAIQPICLSFEDLQWADKSSLDLLRHLSAAISDCRRSSSVSAVSPPRLIIVASARSGYAHLETFMVQPREHRQLLEIRLVPLVESETRELIALRLNCQPDELADDLVVRVHALCGGNPFFVAETIREWYEKEAITRSNAVWILSTEAADTSDLPETVRDVMRLRLQGLELKTQQVVAAATVIGAVVDIDLLRDVLRDFSESDVLDAIDTLLPRRVFRETGNAGRVEFVHDLLREMSYADLSAPRRRSLHRRVAELLESRRASGQYVAPAVLADHFRNAEDQPKAVAYSIEAAEVAMSAYAFNNVLTQLHLAFELLPRRADHSILYHIWEMRGTAYGALGRPDVAIQAHQEALKYAGNRIERAISHECIGEMYHHKGERVEAAHSLDLALRELGYPRPRNAVAAVADIMRTGFCFHLLPAGFRLRRADADRDRRLSVACMTYSRLFQILGMTNVFWYIHGCYRFAYFASQTNDPDLHHYAYTKFSVNCGMFSLASLSNHYIKLARKASALCKGSHITAVARAHVGCAHYFSGRLQEAATDLSLATVTLDKVGDWFGIFSHHVLRHIHTIHADTAAELAEAEWEVAVSTNRGDEETIAWGQYGKALSFARTGRSEEAVDLATIASASLVARGSANTIGIAYSVLSFARLQASDYAGAREAAERSRSASVRAFCVFEFVGLTFPLLVESLLGPHWADSKGGPSRSNARKAWRESYVARFIGWRYPNYHPHALRVTGRAARALGKTKKSARYFERAITAAERLGAPYDQARALIDAACVIPDKADEYRRRGQMILDEIGAVVPEAEWLTAPLVGPNIGLQ
ncbi:ATP-binding protein [Singulisphaera rosea]